MVSGEKVDWNLAAVRRRQMAAAESRAFARGFWWGGGLVTVPALLLGLLVIWDGPAVSGRIPILERMVYSLLVILVGGPLGLMLFGVGPELFLLWWASVFPESIVVREFRNAKTLETFCIQGWRAARLLNSFQQQWADLR
jgi:predicted membrane protein